jgi:hypothetical protein
MLHFLYSLFSYELLFKFQISKMVSAIIYGGDYL